MIWLHISLNIVVIPAPNIECTPRKLGLVLELFILSGIWGYLILAGWDYPNVDPHSWWLECANFLETIIYHHPYHIIYIYMFTYYIHMYTYMYVCIHIYIYYTHVWVCAYSCNLRTLKSPRPVASSASLSVSESGGHGEAPKMAASNREMMMKWWMAVTTLWWTNILPWKDPPFLMGKSTISMAIFHGKMLVHQWLVDFRGHHFGPRPMNWCFQKWQKKCKKKCIKMCPVPLSYNIYSLRRIGYWAKHCRCWRHAGNGDDDFKFLWAFEARNGFVWK